MSATWTETLQIVANDNTRLPAERTLVEPRVRKERPNPFAGMINPITRRPVPGPPEDKRVLYVELIYPFDAKPRSLTIIPPHGKGGLPIASIGFIAYHQGVPVLDYRYLSEAARMHLTWDDPWYSRFENKAFKRWQQSGLKTFLYIEPYEVRHETLVRVKDLNAWMELELRGDEFIEVDEVELLKKRVGEFLLQHSKVTIDGKRLRPILDRTSFVKYTMTRTFFIDQPERMPLNTAMIGVIVTYLTEGIPQEVTVDWDLFTDRIQKVPTQAVDPAGPFPSYVTPDDHILTWQNFLKTYQMPTVAKVTVDDSLTTMGVPMVSLIILVILVPFAFTIRKQRQRNKSIRSHLIIVCLLVGAGILMFPFFHVSVARPAVVAPKINDKQAVVILENLLKNIYRSFDFREESDVYDRLATSVSGDLLTDIYLQNRKSLVVTQAGGAQAKVKEIEIQDVSVKHLDDRPLALLFHSKWTAMGTVGHWGHIHTRKNQYEAYITAEPVDGAWKITALELLEEKRIDPYAKSKI
jgi:preprotein translocase subunit YajC